MAVGGTVVSEWEQLETEFGPIQILSPAQVAMDRLVAYIHWNAPQSLDQAVMIAQSHPLDWEVIEARCASEGGQEQYKVFRRLCDGARAE